MRSTTRRVVLLSALLALALASTPIEQADAQAAGATLGCPRLLIRTTEIPENPTNAYPDPPQTAIVWADGTGVILPGRGTWSPDGGRAVVGLPEAGETVSEAPTPVVAHWDGSEPTPLDLPDVDPTATRSLDVSWAPDGQRFVVVQSGATLATTTTVFDRWGVRLGTIDGEVSEWSPAGTHLVRAGDPGIVVDTTTVPPTAVPFGPVDHVAWSSDGAWLAVTAPGSPMSSRISRPDGSEVTDLGTVSVRPMWRPGTDELVWRPADAADGDPLLVRDHTDGSTRTISLPDHAIDSFPGWSPDGSWLAMTAGLSLWVVPGDDDGSLARQVSVDPDPSLVLEQLRFVRWSPNTSRLAYVTGGRVVSGYEYVRRLGTIDPTTGLGPAPIEIARGDASDLEEVQWSADSTELAVSGSASSPTWPWSWRWHKVLTADLVAAPMPEGSGLSWFSCTSGGVPATTATPTIPPPPAPAPPQLGRTYVQPDAVQLSWAAAWTPLAGMRTAWEVHRDDTGGVLTLPPTAWSTAVAPGAPGSQVTFSVRAVGDGGASDWVAFAPFTFPAVREVSGTVTSGGQPVAGATITLSPATGWTDHVTTTATDGTWSFGTIQVGDDHQLHVDSPSAVHTDQWVLGIDLAARASTTMTVDLSPGELPGDDLGPVVSLHGTPRRAIQLRTGAASDDDPSFAVTTDEEVLVLDGAGRLLLRYVDRHGADGICAARGKLVVDRGGRVDLLHTSAPVSGGPDPTRTITLPGPTTGDVACTRDRGAVVLAPSGTTGARLAEVDLYGQVTEQPIPAGLERIVGPDVGGSTRLLWGTGGVVVDDPAVGITAPTGPLSGFGPDTEVTLTGPETTAWSSTGWRLDLATLAPERVAELAGGSIDAAPARRVVAVGGDVIDLHTGSTLRSDPGTTASAFSVDERRLLLVDGSGTARVVPTPASPRTVTGTVTSQGEPVAGATVSLSSATVWSPHVTTTADDGTYAFVDVPAQAAHSLTVTPRGRLASQTLTGFGLLTPPAGPLDVELSSWDIDPAIQATSADLGQEIHRVVSIAESSPFAGGLAISTVDEVAVLDDHGRLRLRVLGRDDAAGLATTFEHLVIGRPGSIDTVRLSAPWTVISRPSQPLPFADVAAHWFYGYAVVDGPEQPPGVIAASVSNDVAGGESAPGSPWFDVPPRLTGIGNHEGGSGIDMLLWGDGRVVTRRAGVTGGGPGPGPEPLPPLDTTGPGFATGEEVVGSSALGRAWSSDGWTVDLISGERSQDFPTDGDHLALEPTWELLVRDGGLFELDGVDPVRALPADGPAAFFAGGSAIAVADVGGVVHLVPSISEVPTPPAPTTADGTADGIDVTWGHVAEARRPVTSWEIRRDDSDAVVTLPASQLDATLPLGALGSTVTFSIRAVGPGGASDWVDFAPVAMPVFTDIGFDHPFRPEVEQAHALGYVEGYPDGTFRPGLAVSRQAAVTVLWRAAGSPTGRPDPDFSDVDPDHPFRDAIAWAADEGITTGYPDGTFRGDNSATRQAWTAFLWRADGEPAVDPGCEHPGFPDVDDGNPFHDAITWAACADITTGYDDGTFRPTATVTRQTAAATLVRAG